MWARAILFIAFSVTVANSEYVRKKICKDVDSSLCVVHSVIVDPCRQGPSFCLIRPDKSYGMTINMTPKFSASKLKLAVYGDVAQDDSYSVMFRPPKDACDYLFCPMQAEERKLFDMNFSVDKRANGKFPLKVKLWNEEDESQACCFTFTVKAK
ncbi:MD-2-related lipid-recognition protein-like [Manduca sexta]|uniref:MD-2-related lipid-recognition domain-containing protein n=1 Tax=Manduca sexta TaxID=7130 RepID=A0A921ZE15_MANSE|nr:MD-2-related lipid-recognition protein-like [Manduca sexta]KAG6456253.1 hypothetical protein O3G_MSEX009648 [Manduca sexta]KAG6456254.1 hypothetical protein O3G_MSEX009648 [Manduca sexta]KAG6456255.1 hypothetical protein O3G_MSEX009648 [Manduca sexta]